MNWMEEFAERATGRLRDAPYRARARAELLDHLGSLYQAGLDRGLSEEEARRETLDKIGPLPALRRRYRRAELALRSQGRTYCLRRIFLGACLMGALYIAWSLTLEQIIPALDGYSKATAGLSHLGGLVSPLEDLAAYERAVALTGLLYQLPFLLGAFWLRWAFRFRARPLRPIAAGLLLAWGGEKLAILSISALIYQMPLWDLAPLIQRIHGSAIDVAVAFFTVPYILWTLGFVLLLALLAARIPTRAQKAARLC